MYYNFLSIHQPNFLPWIGVIQRIAISDIFVILDNVQYSKNQFQNRNTILTPSGKTTLTVPVCRKTNKIINQIEICNNNNWKKKHIDTIYFSYKKCRYFSGFYEILEQVYKKDFCLLIDLNVELLRLILKYLEINVEIVFSSTLDVQEGKTNRLVDICEKLNAKNYIYGGDSSYLDKDAFNNRGIHTIAQDFKHPIYSQLYSKVFVSNLSVIDWLFHVSQKDIKFLLSQQKEEMAIANRK